MTHKVGQILVWNSPATAWREALPLGNGHLGAMVHGGVSCERIDLSEATFFSGCASESDNRPGAPEWFGRARNAARAKDWMLCRQHLESFVGLRNDYGTNLPVGRLVVEQLDAENSGVPRNYRRSIDMGAALVETGFSLDGCDFRRTVLASHPDRVLCLHWTTDRPGGLDLRIRPETWDGQAKTFGQDGDDLVWESQALETMHSEGQSGVRLAARVRVVCREGLISCTREGLRVEGAGTVTILVALETDFGTTLGPVAAARERLDRLRGKTWEAILADHRADHERLFGRVSLCLGPVGLPESIEPEDPALPDSHLAACLFQYGRYLLIASSRSDSRLPAHLQGAWNDSVAARIGWTCDMHLDINTQMNYWPAEVANLADCVDPLFRWMEERLVPAGRRCARESYGLDGWVAELVSNAWGYAAPYWHVNLSPCPTGGVWLLTHAWEHWQFGQDRDFLRDRFWPLARGAVEFFVRYVFEDGESGILTSGPSVSPENLFADPASGQACAASIGPAYELVMIRELYTIFLAAAAELGIRDALVDQVAGQLPRLDSDRIGPDGALAEWSHDLPALDPQHRHTSHLLGLFPFNQIDPVRTPALADAARRTLELRTTPEAGWEDTGWARSMLMLYAARLRDGDLALRHMRAMFRNLTNPNLMVRHPPTRGAPAFADVYELDGNTGFTACVAECLLQSQEGAVELLPALPAAWGEGEFRGLRARGGLTVDLAWKDGRPIRLVCRADRDGEREFSWKGHRFVRRLTAGMVAELELPRWQEEHA